ncbi:MAG: amylosucrase [Gammaproteobacteria bacterium HGW-Gammaproteobacteria-4]|jgi:amylosucrase|nr:MAG: amylosucrase [Gammaproteobacteria bacterium HGW-Gammaproteobacteria-4]
MSDLFATARRHFAAGLVESRRGDALARFDAHGPRLFGLLSSLYALDGGVTEPIRCLLAGLAQCVNQRPDDLFELDAARPADWLDRADMIGYSTYVERFAGTLDRVRERVPYLHALGIRYLHLLPFLKARSGDNDGGFAVSDYGQVEPALGSNADLDALAARLRESGISLAADFVLNHCADDHPWALAARSGDPHFRQFFHVYTDRAQIERLEADLPQVFPESAPGNFSFVPELDAWVWATFNRYQWDLNWSNPDLFQHMALALLRLANRGVEIFRLDSAAYLWKRAGTDCRNLPEAHAVLQSLRAILEIAAPSVALKAEVIVPLPEVAPYFGTGDRAGTECQIAYHSSLMAASWAALAEQRADILADVIARTPAPPAGCVWLNYVRCHDDIGWWVLREEATGHTGHDGFDLARIARFYSGDEPDSYAEGEAFQSSDPRAFHGSNGMTASLLGLHRALAAGDDDAIATATRRHLLLYAIVLSAAGVPLIYMGDEYGLGNHSAYRRSGDDDGRWLHRPDMDWALAQAAPFDRLRAGIDRLIQARRRCASLTPSTAMRTLPFSEPGLLGIARGAHFIGLYNLSAQPIAVSLTQLPSLDGRQWHDLLCRAPCANTFTLAPYDLRWLESP